MTIISRHHHYVVIVGALTKGDRRAATGADLTEFNFDTNYGRTALRTLYNAISSVSYQSINPSLNKSLNKSLN